ncbi:DNA primase [Balneatrix alpica]|uniref:DNA primase n=1 Tax=Balneatrix alpica TaxID=75684 RepID=A0ABV5ZD58_9GAMM|nr:DNA primase [Balneatrix alpica]
MAGKIPQHFIDDLLARVDIVDIIDERVPLKKAGKNYVACCPFHQEKTPSFSVSPDKQFYYCFGCGASGTALSFVMEFERLEFPLAVEALAKRAGMEVPREQQDSVQLAQQREQHQAIYDILEEAAEWYSQQLKHHPARQNAVNYLKGRGLSGQAAQAFRLGFAPPGWDNLLNALGTSASRRQALIDAGLVIDKPEEGKTYDRFRDRIQFPIRDKRGRIIGFGGRVLGDDKPKYLNSPETPVFHKNQELYGFFEARKYGRKQQRFLIVEGYMDVIMLAQYGLHDAVATLGTATSSTHLEVLYRQVEEIVFCFDGDQAGRKAAERALHSVLPLLKDGRQARFLFLPEGEDPDTLVQQEGLAEFERRINRALSCSDFLFDFAQQGLDLHQAEHKALLCKRALPLLNLLPADSFIKPLMLDNLAHRTGLDKAQIQQLAEHSPVATPPTPAPVSQPNEWDDTAHWQPMEMDEQDYYYLPETATASKAPRKPFKKRQGYGDKRGFKEQDEPPQPPLPKASIHFSPTRAAIIALLRDPGLAAEQENELDYLKVLADEEIDLLLSLLDYLKQQPQADFAELAAHFDFDQQPARRILQQSSDISYQAIPGEEARFFRNNLIRLQIDAIQRQFDSMQLKLTQGIRFSEAEMQEYRDLQPKRLALQQQLKMQG